MTDSNDDRGRSTAEWFTLGVSCLILGLVAALIVGQMLRDRDPASPVAEVSGPTRRAGDVHHIPVRLTNEGDDTATNVVVSAELVVDGETSSAEQTVAFLAGGAHEQLVFVFEDDPSKGDLTVAVTSYAEP